ncbi:MAG: M14 family zinc carboxypeptidase [Pseudobdellovibrio sp.]
MMKYKHLILALLSLYSIKSLAQVEKSENKEQVVSATLDVVSQATVPATSLSDFCVNSLKAYKSYKKEDDLVKACMQVVQMQGCSSVQGKPIYHVEKKGKTEKAKNILVISLIHGDEIGAGSLGRYWMERINEIDPRNTWRIIPVANPDGAEKKTRTNSDGVDLNRNFPTKDWQSDAAQFWKNKSKGAERKFPGDKAASEPEVNCLINHINDFKPDFVVSIHTPLNVLDFDGPKVKAPHYSYLPWRRLGNFPGSLGRYLWVEQNIPVLTTELKYDLPKTEGVFEQLQDVIGYLVQTDIK